MRRFWPVLLGVLLAVRTTGATVVIPTDFREVVAGASLIVRGEVTDVRGIATPVGIESIATVAVSAVLKGDAGGAFVSVRVPGGTVGRYRRVMVGAPVLRAGESAVFFLVRGSDFAWRPVALTAGVAPVLVDPETRRAVVRAPGVDGGGAAAARAIGRVVRSVLPVDEFESLVRVVVADQRLAVRRPQ